MNQVFYLWVSTSYYYQIRYRYHSKSVFLLPSNWGIRWNFWSFQSIHSRPKCGNNTSVIISASLRWQIKFLFAMLLENAYPYPQSTQFSNIHIFRHHQGQELQKCILFRAKYRLCKRFISLSVGNCIAQSEAHQYV